MKRSTKIGSLIKVPIRDLFQHEAYDFTSWLGNNIHVLADRLDMLLVIEGKEVPVGKFRADLVCSDIQGNRIVIENQLESTDHDHLGKLLTYMANLKANTAIWITPNPRIEHQVAIEHLNAQKMNGFAFYLVKVEAIKIDDSNPTPLFTVLARPAEQPSAVVETEPEQFIRDAAKPIKQNSDFPPVWCLYPRRDEPTYKLFLEEKIIGLGFGDDLEDLRKIDAIPEAFKERWLKKYPLSSPAEARTFYAMFYSLVHRMGIGDLVVYAPTWRERTIYVGKIKSDYYYQRKILPFYAHRRDVEWIEEFPRDIFSPEALKGITVTLAVFQARNEVFLSELESKFK
jgi:hypothetical protein